jgi:MFS family permease
MSHKSGRSWIVVGATFITLGMVYGIWYAYSVFFVAFLREFGWSRSIIAGGYSAMTLIHGACSPITGWLAGRIGSRRVILMGGCVFGCGLFLTADITRWWHLYLAFGAIAGMGLSMSGWVPSVLLVRRWFPGRVGTAVGVASAGIGVGMAGLVPLAQFLIDWCGWRWAFRLLGMLILGWVVPATIWLVRDPSSIEGSDSGSEPRGVREHWGGETYWTLATAVRDLHYWGLAGVFFTGNVVTQMLLVHQVAYLVDHGVSVLAAATVSAVAGLASIAGKMGWGTLSDRTGREPAYTLAFVCVVASVGGLVLAGRYPASNLLYLYAVLIGVGYAGTAPLTPAAASDLFSGPGLSTIFGTLHTVQTAGAAFGAWVAGQIFDRTGSYTVALWVALGNAVLAPALMWIVAPRRPHPPSNRSAGTSNRD